MKKYLDNFSDPVIGILTQPLSPYFRRYFGTQYKAYIPSSYKKWVEQTGARAVIVPHFISLERIEKLFT